MKFCSIIHCIVDVEQGQKCKYMTNTDSHLRKNIDYHDMWCKNSIFKHENIHNELEIYNYLLIH